MTTPLEHYQAAEKLLVRSEHVDPDTKIIMIASAQVHAELASAGLSLITKDSWRYESIVSELYRTTQPTIPPKEEA